MTLVIDSTDDLTFSFDPDALSELADGKSPLQNFAPITAGIFNVFITSGNRSIDFSRTEKELGIDPVTIICGDNDEMSTRLLSFNVFFDLGGFERFSFDAYVFVAGNPLPGD